MSFEEEFDKIIRQKAEDAKYSFDEANWHKVSNMLEADRKAEGVSRFTKALLPLGTLLLVGVAGYLTYTSFGTGNSTTLAQEKASQQPKTIAAVQSEVVVSVNETQPLPEVADNAKSISENLAQGPLETDSKTAKPENVVVSKLAKSSLQIGKDFSSSGQEQTILKTDDPAPAITDKPITDAQSINPSGVNNGDVTDGESRSNATKQPVLAFVDTPHLEEAAKTQESQTRVLSQEQSHDPAGDLIVSEVLSPLWVLMPVQNAEYSLMETAQYPLIKDEDYYNQGKLAKKHYLNVDLGAAYLFGWDKNQTKDGKGLDYYAGFNYGRYINRKFSVSAGIQVYNVSNINQPYYSAAHKEYGFGSTTIYTVVTATDLLFASVPLKLNYAVNEYNTLGLGVNVGYLLGANSGVQQYYMRDNEKIMLTPSAKTTQIYDGTQSFNFMITAAYTLRLNNRVAIKAEYLRGLTDLFKNSGTLGVSEKTSGLRFGLQYTLFDK